MTADIDDLEKRVAALEERENERIRIFKSGAGFIANLRDTATHQELLRACKEFVKRILSFERDIK